MFRYFSNYYYTVPLEIFLNLLFIIIGLAKLKRIGRLKILIIYSIACLTQSLLGVMANVLSDRKPATCILLENSINVFVLLEFIFFYQFIIGALASRVARMLFRGVRIIVCLGTIYSWLSSNRFNETPCVFTIAESYLIIIPCLYFYFELFTYRPKVPLQHQADFWAVTGMLFLFLLLAPLFLQSGTLFLDASQPSDAYAMTFVGYAVLYIFFLNAVRCKIHMPKQSR